MELNCLAMEMSVRNCFVGMVERDIGVWECNDRGCVIGGCLVSGNKKWISWLPYDDVMEIWRPEHERYEVPFTKDTHPN